MSRTRQELASGGAAGSVQEEPGTSISRRPGEAGQGWGQRTHTLTRAVALKGPQQCCPGPGSRQAPHGHRVSGARAVRRQRVLRDGAAQPQPLDLEEAAVLRAPGGDVQLGTGHGAGGERAQRTASHSPAVPAAGKLPERRPGSLGPTRGPQRRPEEDRGEFGASTRSKSNLLHHRHPCSSSSCRWSCSEHSSALQAGWISKASSVRLHHIQSPQGDSYRLGAALAPFLLLPALHTTAFPVPQTRTKAPEAQESP